MELTGIPALIALFVFLAIPIWTVVLIGSMIIHRLRRRSRLSRQVIIAEYQPPAHLTPAEVGYLFDSRIGKTEIMATLVDLEQRGYLTLERSPKGDMQISKTGRGSGDLTFHEQYLLNEISSDNNITSFAIKSLWGFKQGVIEMLSARGYAKTRSAHINYYARRTLVAYGVLGVLFMGLLVQGSTNQKWVGLLVGLFFVLIGSPFFLGLAMGASFIYNKAVGQPGLWTEAIKCIWPELEGYRDYVRLVELGRLQFESQELKAVSENHALPYAIALDLNTDWQERLKN